MYEVHRSNSFYITYIRIVRIIYKIVTILQFISVYGTVCPLFTYWPLDQLGDLFFVEIAVIKFTLSHAVQPVVDNAGIEALEQEIFPTYLKSEIKRKRKK